MKKLLKIILFVFIALFVLILIIPTDDNSNETQPTPKQEQTEPSNKTQSVSQEQEMVNEQEPEQELVQDQSATSESPETASPAAQTQPQKEEYATNENETDKSAELYLVTRVIDGDTIEVEINGSKEKLRLIGIDTPETVDPRKPVECFGKEASSKMKSLVEGKQVRLEADTSQGDRGKYGRLLRYVFLPDGTFVNDLMIRQGYAYEYTYRIPYQYQSQFKQAEQEARAKKRGLWDDGVCEDTNSSSQTETIQEPMTLTTQPQSQVEQTPTTTSCDCSGNLYNCSDFKTHQEAQAVFDCCMAQIGKDVHKLDGNNDGMACESLP